MPLNFHFASTFIAVIKLSECFYVILQVILSLNEDKVCLYQVECRAVTLNKKTAFSYFIAYFPLSVLYSSVGFKVRTTMLNIEFKNVFKCINRIDYFFKVKIWLLELEYCRDLGSIYSKVY